MLTGNVRLGDDAGSQPGAGPDSLRGFFGSVARRGSRQSPGMAIANTTETMNATAPEMVTARSMALGARHPRP
ncbi:MAG TPA: hypothetical protein VG164_07310 [Trebonia sp.]|nr:hypothetical protein [Trebonia sp.]